MEAQEKDAKVKVTKQERVKPEIKYPMPEPKERMVPIRLFKDSDRYKDDLFVSVNGQTFLIQRGVDVEVPWYVAEVIQNAIRSDNQADERLRLAMEELKN